MKKLFILLAMMIAPKVFSQTENVGNFPSPVRTVHYQSGTSPLGAFPIWTTRGIYFYSIDTDTIRLTKFGTKEETMDNRLIWIKTNGDLSSFTPDYLRSIDTATMLSGYQRLSMVRRITPYLGTTDGSGNYTVTFSSAYGSAPHIQAVLINPTTQQQVRTTSVSTTGFTVNATNRATVNLLGVDVLLGNTTALSGAPVSVLVVER